MTNGRYVDDISGGADSLDQLLLITHQLTELCQLGGFRLAKWKSNHPELLSSVISDSSHIAEDPADAKVLGLLWVPYSDHSNLMYNYHHYWIQATQLTFFADTLHILSTHRSLPNSHPIVRLTPLLDHTGLLRLEGRLKHSILDTNSKHPIILPNICPL